MAQKRMFSLQVIDTDRFMDMPSSSQALYFHLGMHGDDDGFVSAPKKITRAAGCSDDDLRLLAQKGYIIPFDSGVIVITDWKLNNTLKNDRYHGTEYQAEKAMLQEDSSGRYLRGTNMEPVCFQDGTEAEPEHSITKQSVTKQSINSGRTSRRTHKPFSPPTLQEVQDYVRERNSNVDPQGFIDFYASKGWMVGRSKMKDWRAACRRAEKWDCWGKERDRVRTDAEYYEGW